MPEPSEKTCGPAANDNQMDRDLIMSANTEFQTAPQAMPKDEPGHVNWQRAALVALAVAGLVAAWTLLPVAQWIESFRAWVASQGLLGHAAFIVVYAAATVALAPAGLLTLAAGFAFGLWAFPTVVIGATLGLSLAFLAGRYLARDWVAGQTAKSPMFKALDRAIESEGWKIVALVRLSPLIPFNLQNYFFGLTRIGFLPYVVTSFFGIMPGTLLYVWLGSLGAAAGEVGEGRGTLETIALAIGLLATLAVTVLISRKARQKLHEIGVDEITDDARP